MKQDKDLLLKYLCMSLPYKIAIKDDYGDTIFLDYNDVHIQNYFEGIVDGVVRPYLRSMSSMTKEEEYEFLSFADTLFRYGKDHDYCCLSLDAILWLLEHHFDFMGLIPKDLAIEVTENNNPYENEF